MSWNGWYLMRSMYLMIDVPKTVWVWMWSVNAWVSANGPLEKIDLLFWTYLYFELSVFSKYSKLFRIPTTFCKNYRTPQNIFILREWMWLSFVYMCLYEQCLRFTIRWGTWILSDRWLSDQDSCYIHVSKRMSRLCISAIHRSLHVQLEKMKFYNRPPT